MRPRSRPARGSPRAAARSPAGRRRRGSADRAPARSSLPQVAPHLVRELPHADRLGEIAVEALGVKALLVAAHGGGGERDDRDVLRARVLLDELQGLRPAQVGHPDVHQHESGVVLLRERNALDSAGGLESGEPGELVHVARELSVVGVVVDDEDQLTQETSCWAGRVKRNVLPCPGSLSTQRRPPWSSTSLRERGSPSPVPSAFLPSVVCSNSSKIVSWSAGAMPGPVSAIAISTSPSSSRAETPTRPPSGVNLTALERRLNTIWRTRRSSAAIVISPGSVDRPSSTPLRLACSECMETALPSTAGTSTCESSSSM